MNFLRKCKFAVNSMIFTVVLSGTAASLCGLDFYVADLFEVLVKRTMSLDGNAQLPIDDFFINMGIHSVALTVFFALCLLYWGYYVFVILLLIKNKLGRIFFHSRLKTRNEELPTMRYSQERLFEEPQEQRKFDE